MRVPSVGLPSRNQITLVDLREWPHAILKEQIRERLFVAETPVRRVWAWGFRIRENSFFLLGSNAGCALPRLPVFHAQRLHIQTETYCGVYK